MSPKRRGRVPPQIFDALLAHRRESLRRLNGKWKRESERRRRRVRRRAASSIQRERERKGRHEKERTCRQWNGGEAEWIMEGALSERALSLARLHIR